MKSSLNVLTGSMNVTDWEELCEQNAEVLVLFERFDDEAVRAAQKQELDTWKSNDVYQEVPDNDQHALSVRWVITEKFFMTKNASKHAWWLEGTKSKKSI